MGSAVSVSVKSATNVGNVADLTINRDSCGSSAQLWAGRVLWTCRDSQPYDSSGNPTLPIYSSSASWTGFSLSGDPLGYMTGNNNEEPFFPYQSDECNTNSAGGCSDGTRWVLWPNSPPLVTSGGGTATSGTVTAYTWIPKVQLEKGSLTPVDATPPTSLYKVTYDASLASSSPNTLPSVSLVQEEFFGDGAIAFGSYGNVLASDGTVYLYGQGSNSAVFLAKVPAGSSVEDVSQYQYYDASTSSWSGTAPAIGDSSASIPNASAGGQGTYYFSSAWNSYVWIGQPGENVAADFMLTTAPDPTGPWQTPVSIYQGEGGNSSIPAYSLQANPALSSDAASGVNEIYLTYTQANTNGYATPLIQVVFN